MAVISVRLNKREEEILNYLTDYLHEDKSTLFRKSLVEMYEDIQDIRFIEQYVEESEIRKKIFISGEELFE
jgi:predicted DNA-binding protein